MRETINAAIIKNKRILLVRKRQSWLLPGGKPNRGESDIGCLCREVREELSGTKLKNIIFYGEFIGKTHIGEEFKARVYFADINGILNPPSSEIEECLWTNNVSQYRFSEMNLKVMASLRRGGYIE